LLHELLPTATTFGLLVDPTNPNTETADMQAAADLHGYKLVVAGASTATELDTVFAGLVQQRIDALVVAGQGFFTGDRVQQLATLALHDRVPTIYPSPDRRTGFPVGCLMGYGGSFAEAYHHAGIYTGRILKGDKPAELPVQTPTKFELFINLKTASALGLTIPPGLLAIADELVE
jgi:putative ABC transport system substrate-binding protein